MFSFSCNSPKQMLRQVSSPAKECYEVLDNFTERTPITNFLHDYCSFRLSSIGIKFHIEVEVRT